MSLKRMLILLITGFLLLGAAPTYSCVGKILYVGAQDSDSEKIMAELLVLLINERTGTNVQIRYFGDTKQLYAALQTEDEEKRADIIIEDTKDGLQFLGLERMADPDQEYIAVKDKYDKQFNMIWLNPFGFASAVKGEPPTRTAPLLRRDILTNFPLLPRILNKLSDAINDEAYAGIIEKVNTGTKPKNAAKDFLRAKKLI